MKFNILKTRNGKLRNKLTNNFPKNKLTDKDVETLMIMVEDYEKANLATIEKLKKDKSLESKRISGALKQTINAHGPITKELIGSATKRIYGTLLKDNNNSDKFITIHKGNLILMSIFVVVSIVLGFISWTN
jgi:hypothetical protein